MAVDLRGRLDQPPTIPFRYIKALDGVRGVGILVVMFGHYAAGLSEWAKTRFFGVSLTIDLFFVLSGFLITTLLLEEWSKTGRISMRNFYVRRGLRLLPALFVLLAFVLVVAFATDWLPLKLTIAEVGAAALYVYPVILVAKGEQAFLFHLWTLSVEEWFYFIWPAVLLVVGLRRRTLASLRAVVGLLLGFVVVCFLIRQIDNGDVLSRLVGALRPDSLAYGALLAFLARWWKEFPDPRWSRVFDIVGPVGFLGYLYFAWLATYPRPAGLTEAEFHDIAFRSWNYRLGILSCFLMILHIVHRPEGRISRVFSWRPVVYIGILSYALYLWHQPLFLLANQHLFHGDPTLEDFVPHSVPVIWAFGLAVAAASFVVAFASRVLVEKPALAQKARFEVVHYESKR